MKSYLQYIRMAVFDIVSLVIAGLLRYAIEEHELTDIAEMIAKQVIFFIYLFIILLWGLNIRRRVMHRKIRRYLLYTVVIMIFWLLLREIKYDISVLTDTKRQLGYYYYVPMLFIPVMSFFGAYYIKKPEIYRRPNAYKLLWAGSALMATFVLTNDYHQYVFGFYNGLANIDDYSYNWGYYVVAAYIGAVVIATVINVIKKCQRDTIGNARYYPLMYIFIAIVYGVWYIQDDSVYGAGFVELMIMFDWITIVIWEVCASLGMVPNNNYYDDFFKGTNIRMQILDKEGRVILSAKDAVSLSAEDFRTLKQTGDKYYDSKTMLKMYPIDCGYVIWQEDVGELNDMIEDLYQNREEIVEANDLAEEEMKLKVRQRQIDEQNRLYTILTDEMHNGLEKINDCAKLIEKSGDAGECERLLGRMNIIGVALKRRSNFIMINEEKGYIPPEELRLCLNEIARNLALIGMTINFSIKGSGPLDVYQVLYVCDRVQLMVEDYIYNEKFMDVVFNIEDDVLSADVHVKDITAHIVGSRRDGDKV